MWLALRLLLFRKVCKSDDALHSSAKLNILPPSPAVTTELPPQREDPWIADENHYITYVKAERPPPVLHGVIERRKKKDPHNAQRQSPERSPERNRRRNSVSPPSARAPRRATHNPPTCATPEGPYAVRHIVDFPSEPTPIDSTNGSPVSVAAGTSTCMPMEPTDDEQSCCTTAIPHNVPLEVGYLPNNNTAATQQQQEPVTSSSCTTPLQTTPPRGSPPNNSFTSPILALVPQRNASPSLGTPRSSTPLGHRPSTSNPSSRNITPPPEGFSGFDFSKCDRRGRTTLSRSASNLQQEGHTGFPIDWFGKNCVYQVTSIGTKNFYVLMPCQRTLINRSLR